MRLRVLGRDGVDGDAPVEPDADDGGVPLRGEVVGHGELLGRRARDAQLRLVTGPRHGGASLRKNSRITRGRRIHNYHDPPLGSGRGALRAADDDKREDPGQEEGSERHTYERTTYDDVVKWG
jgi:hypothetical protein